MKTIFQQHLEAIKEKCIVDDRNAVVHVSKAAKACEDITLKFAKGYLNWAEQNYYRSGKYQWTSHTNVGMTPKNDDEVLKDYINSLDKTFASRSNK